MPIKRNCAFPVIMALLVAATASIASAWGNSKDISADGSPQSVEPTPPADRGQQYVEPTPPEYIPGGWRGHAYDGDKHHGRFYSMIVEQCYDQATRRQRHGLFGNAFGMGHGSPFGHHGKFRRISDRDCCNNSVKWCKSARRATSMDRLVAIKRLNSAVMEANNGIAGKLRIAHAVKEYKRNTIDALETSLRCEVVAGGYCAHEKASLSAYRAIHNSWMEEEKMLGRIFYEIARTQDICKGLKPHSSESKYGQVAKSTTTAKISTAAQATDARTKQLCSRDWNERGRTILHLMRDLDKMYSRIRMENGCKNIGTYRSFWNENDKKYDVKPQEAVYNKHDPQERTLGH